jgi:predicted enzyme related to lactoylglutathione lyase
MASSILAVVVDCHDALAVAQFWAAALDRRITERNPREFTVGHPSADPTCLYFMEVAEPKAVKNRLHVDVITPGALDDEVERLRGLGAELVEVRTDPGTLTNPDRWAVMLDPEGNEFCVTSTTTLSGWFEPS